MMRKTVAVFAVVAFVGSFAVLGTALAEKRPDQIGTFSVETMT